MHPLFSSYDIMSASEKNVLARSASDECRSCAGSAHDIMGESESTCWHVRRATKLLSELAHDIMSNQIIERIDFKERSNYRIERLKRIRGI